MSITLEQKLDCLTNEEYYAIENIVDIILMNRRDKKSFSDGGKAPAQPDVESVVRWQHEDTGYICELPPGEFPGGRYYKIPDAKPVKDGE